MFENIIKFFKNISKKEKNKTSTSKDAAKERLHLVLMQDRANVSADFLELMKQEIIDVIKKYIDVDESAIDVRLTNKENDDGTNGAPALYANIPIINIKNESRKLETKEKEIKKEKNQEENKGEDKDENKQGDVPEKTDIEENKENDDEIVQEEKDNENEQKEESENSETESEIIIDDEDTSDAKEELKSETKTEKE